MQKNGASRAPFALLVKDDRSGFYFVGQRLHRQPDLALPVDLQHLDAHGLALGQLIADLFDPIVGNLRNVHQAITPRHQIDERAEIHQAHDLAFVDLAGFDIAGDVLDALDGQIRCRLVDRGHVDGAVVLDVDIGAGFFRDAADRGAALADHVTDLVDVDLDGEDAWRPFGGFLTRRGDGVVHGGQAMQTPFQRLLQRYLHDLAGDAADLDVQLQRRDAVLRAGHLEVHVAEMVLVTENIGEHGELVAVLDQTHGDTGHRRADRHAGIHQRQAAAAHRGHGGRTVGFGDFGDDLHDVGEFLLQIRQHTHDGALGELAMADFTPLRTAHET